MRPSTCKTRSTGHRPLATHWSTAGGLMPMARANALRLPRAAQAELRASEGVIFSSKHDLAKKSSGFEAPLGGRHTSVQRNRPMVKTLGETLAEARIRAGYTLQAAADALGVTNQAINQWEMNRTKPRAERLRRVCELYGVDPSVIVKASTNSAVQNESRDGVTPNGATVLPGRFAVPNAMPAPGAPSDALAARVNWPLDVPVLGVTVGGEDSDFQFSGETVDYVRRPVGIANAKRAYATYVVGDSMLPAFKEGSIIYVNPDKPPAIGDNVVIELYPDSFSGDHGEHKSGKGYIKELVRRTPTKIVVKQWNPVLEIEFDRDTIKEMHRVVPWNELLGV
ncbi:XRE family transcriptional regulator [Methylobacterium indicum]|uniref:XRE family transcriptional regulator n=1 Tax=Methylobacterium indicum TaxID=1775910 RepID=UPI001FCB3AC8|nr:XRE family transcriptional regulator [Methylobacterium indicum]